MAHKLYQQVAEEIITRIDGGYYAPGQKLPSIRALAREHNVSISTVQEAYRVLEERSFTEVRPKSGHFVKARNFAPVLPDVEELPQRPVEVSAWSDILHMLNADEAENMLNLGWAIPDLHSPTLKPLMREMNQISRRHGMRSLSYDYVRGNVGLRRQIARLGVDSGLQLHPDEILVTSGCQEALACSLRAITKPGDIVAVDSPFYFGAVQTIEASGLKAIEIPSHPQTGTSIEALELALAQWPVKVLVLTPTCNNPMGYSMPEAQRPKILDLCNRYDVVVIEDDIYGDLGFDQETVPLASYDTQDRVILCGSVSKSLSRDLRVGWVISRRWQSELLRLKLATQLAGSRVTQRALANFIRNGDYRRHLLQFKRSLQMQRNQLLSAMKSYWPKQAQYQVPHGGLALWVVLPQECDTNDLYQTMLPQGIILTPGSLFSSQGAFHHCLRLSFNQPYVGRRLTAIKTLGRVLNTKISC